MLILLDVNFIKSELNSHINSDKNIELFINLVIDHRGIIFHFIIEFIL